MGDASCAVVARARDRIERGGVGVVSREEEAEDDVEECEEAVERVAGRRRTRTRVFYVFYVFDDVLDDDGERCERWWWSRTTFGGR